MALPTDSGASDSEKAPSAADVARDWRCSRAYVTKLVKKGCALTSLAAARKWREENARYGVGYRSKSAAKPEAPQTGSQKAAPPKDAPNVQARDLTTLDASLAAAIEVEQEAHRLVAVAQKAQNDALIAVRIAAYNKARDGRFATETAYREELERRRVLVELNEAKAIARKGYDVMVPLLRALSKNAGPLCNPSDPLHASRILEQQIEAIIAQAEKEYAT